MSLQIGITGGIGSGKSTVCKVFATLGIPIYDADSRAKYLMANSGKIKTAVKDFFGNEAYFENGELNRAYLAQQIFSDSQKAKTLEHIVHPEVAMDYKLWVKENSAKSPYLLKEAALMFETGGDKLLDKVILVSAAEDLRIKRVLTRDSQRSEEQLRAIIKKQMPESEKQKRANYVINNDGKQGLIAQVLTLHQEFIKIN
jgi:dephospho-CoA kinase